MSPQDKAAFPAEQWSHLTWGFDLREDKHTLREAGLEGEKDLVAVNILEMLEVQLARIGGE